VPETIPLWLLVALIVVAVVLGLWVGGRANRELESRRADERGATLAGRARSAMTRGILSLWKWNRSRKKRARDEESS
jgi:hypothetical protein